MFCQSLISGNILLGGNVVFSYRKRQLIGQQNRLWVRTLLIYNKLVVWPLINHPLKSTPFGRTCQQFVTHQPFMEVIYKEIECHNNSNLARRIVKRFRRFESLRNVFPPLHVLDSLSIHLLCRSVQPCKATKSPGPTMSESRYGCRIHVSEERPRDVPSRVQSCNDIPIRI